MKILVIEDEFRTRKAIISIAEKIGDDISVVGWAENVEQSIKLIEEKRPDLVLMDIQLTDGTAFDVLKEIDTVDFRIIFLTAYENYAIEAIKFSAFDYLLKPFTEEELTASILKFKDTMNTESKEKSVEVLLNNLKENTNKKIILKTNNDLHIVSISSIVRCEAESSYTHFFLYNGTEITVSKNLKKFEQDLKPYHFVRVHNSHIINVDYITKFSNNNGGVIELINGTTIPVSKRKKEELIKIISEL